MPRNKLNGVVVRYNLTCDVCGNSVRDAYFMEGARICRKCRFKR